MAAAWSLSRFPERYEARLRPRAPPSRRVGREARDSQLPVQSPARHSSLPLPSRRRHTQVEVWEELPQPGGVATTCEVAPGLDLNDQGAQTLPPPPSSRPPPPPPRASLAAR